MDGAPIIVCCHTAGTFLIPAGFWSLKNAPTFLLLGKRTPEKSHGGVHFPAHRCARGPKHFSARKLAWLTRVCGGFRCCDPSMRSWLLLLMGRPGESPISTIPSSRSASYHDLRLGSATVNMIAEIFPSGERRHEKPRRGTLGAVKKLRRKDGAGVLTSGKARRRSIAQASVTEDQRRQRPRKKEALIPQRRDTTPSAIRYATGFSRCSASAAWSRNIMMSGFLPRNLHSSPADCISPKAGV